MRFATIASSISLILALDLILFLGAAVPDLRPIRPLVDGLVAVIDVSLVVSSGLLGFWFHRGRRRLLAAAFGMNIAMIGVAYLLGISGYRFPLPILYVVDLYWLNLYLACLPRHYGRLFANPA